MGQTHCASRAHLQLLGQRLGHVGFRHHTQLYQHLAQVAAQLLLRLQGVLQIALVQLAGGKEAFAQPPLDRGFDSGNRFHEVIGGRHCRGLSTVAASPAKGIACDTQGRRLPVINCYVRNRAARCCAAR